MHREKITTLLKLYNDQHQSRDEIINFICNNENCFDRELNIGHITGSAWLLNKQGNKALLMHHAKLDKWLQPGGHADGNSDIISVAIKEAQEESGISSIELIYKNIFDIDIHLIPKNSKEEAHYHYDIRFLLQVTSEEELKQNSESKELKWFSFEEISTFTKEESILRMNKKIKKFLPISHV